MTCMQCDYGAQRVVTSSCSRARTHMRVQPSAHAKLESGAPVHGCGGSTDAGARLRLRTQPRVSSFICIR